MLVVDASVMVKLATAEPGSDLAKATVIPRDDCIAPEFIYLEVASALSKKVRTADLRAEDVSAGMAIVPPLLLEVVPNEQLLSASIDLSIELGHSIFDCLYLALALDRGCTLLTADEKFRIRAHAAGYENQIVSLL